MTMNYPALGFKIVVGLIVLGLIAAGLHGLGVI